MMMKMWREKTVFWSLPSVSESVQLLWLDQLQKVKVKKLSIRLIKIRFPPLQTIFSSRPQWICQIQEQASSGRIHTVWELWADFSSSYLVWLLGYYPRPATITTRKRQGEKDPVANALFSVSSVRALWELETFPRISRCGFVWRHFCLPIGQSQLTIKADQFYLVALGSRYML